MELNQSPLSHKHLDRQAKLKVVRQLQVYQNLLRAIMWAQDRPHYANWVCLVLLGEVLFVVGVVRREHLKPNRVRPQTIRHNNCRIVAQAFPVVAVVGAGRGEAERRTCRQATSLQRPLRGNQHQILAVREAVA